MKETLLVIALFISIASNIFLLFQVKINVKAFYTANDILIKVTDALYHNKSPGEALHIFETEIKKHYEA